MPKRTVFIIGAGGMVGASAASALALGQVAHTIALIDINEDLVRGQAMDLNHATAYSHGVHVRVGDYDEITPNDIVVITAGLAQRPDGQSRLSLLDANAGIIAGIAGKLKIAKPAFILVVSNPVDALTHLTWEITGLPRERVFGTGTALDTARLRVLLAQALHVSQSAVQADVLGEHGDTSFAALSSARIGGIRLADFPGYTPELTSTINDDIRASAAKIIAAKKSTYFGIGHMIAQIVSALMRPSATVFPVSVIPNGEYGLQNLAIGLPALISDRGAVILDHYPLNQTETKQLKHSADILASTINSNHQRRENIQTVTSSK